MPSLAFEHGLPFGSPTGLWGVWCWLGPLLCLELHQSVTTVFGMPNMCLAHAGCAGSRQWQLGQTDPGMVMVPGSDHSGIGHGTLARPFRERSWCPGGTGPGMVLAFGVERSGHGPGFWCRAVRAWSWPLV